MLKPIAEAILVGRDFAWSMSDDHLVRFGLPLTVMAKAHAMRSAVIAQVARSDSPGFALVDKYVEFGRVEVVHLESRTHYLLKARSVLPLQSDPQLSLLSATNGGGAVGEAPLHLLAYQFEHGYLSLASVPARKVKRENRTRYLLLGSLREQGSWRIDQADAGSFDQGLDDDFGDLSAGVDVQGEDWQ